MVDSHVQAISASLTGPNVATITIAHSGSTHETVAATTLVREARTTTICVTNFGKSPLLAFADIVLHTTAREIHFRIEAMTSRIAQLAIIDAFIACLSLADKEKALQIPYESVPKPEITLPERVRHPDYAGRLSSPELHIPDLYGDQTD